MSNNATKYTPLTTQINSTDDKNNVIKCNNCSTLLSDEYLYCKVCTKEYCSLMCFEMANFKLNHLKCFKQFFFPR